MRGQEIIAQCLLKPVNNAGSGTRDYRIAILEWTGTADTVTSELVADWTSETFTTAGFFASTTKTLEGTATVTATHNTETPLSVSGTVSASCNNLIVFIWTEDVPTHASDYVLIGEVGLYTGSTAQEWSPRLIAHELNLCKRYFEMQTALTGMRFSVGYCDTNATHMGMMDYQVEKFAVPNISLSALSDFGIVQGATVSDLTAASFAVKTTTKSTTYYTGTGTPYTANVVSFIRAANDNAKLYIESEL
jgi:hypothetical protein